MPGCALVVLRCTLGNLSLALDNKDWHPPHTHTHICTQQTLTDYLGCIADLTDDHTNTPTTAVVAKTTTTPLPALAAACGSRIVARRVSEVAVHRSGRHLLPCWASSHAGLGGPCVLLYAIASQHAHFCLRLCPDSHLLT
jgi:hypothetical protein